MNEICAQYIGPAKTRVTTSKLYLYYRYLYPL